MGGGAAQGGSYDAQVTAAAGNTERQRGGGLERITRVSVSRKASGATACQAWEIRGDKRRVR